ncbi:alginate export family protein [Solitalea lacus]|uniref:alginate export family protein n=1 Tax=Solitalea lacus TaxID=2911172 RepID=UPI001EDA861C|nr:alginate export family protein [Solitalea lacus]UKJ08507.1 alginate export family protein [Solitalea lacus]
MTVIVLIAITSNAQITLTGELRPRFEYRHGYKALSETNMDAAAFISQRTRLNLGYANDKLQTKLALQDVRVWGNQSQLNASDALFSLHEAWGEYAFTKRFSAKLGRQEIAYDDERIMGAVNWSQQGRSHDAAVLKYVDSTLTMHIGFAFNQDQEQFKTTKYTIANSYKDMQYLWLNKKWSNLALSYLFLNVGQQSPEINSDSRHSFTTGTHLTYKIGKLAAVGKGYYSGGIDVNKKDIQAFLIGGDLTYGSLHKFSVTAGYEFQSGQSQTNTSTKYNKVNHSFNPVFGTNHPFNGYMDYFYSGNHLNSVGLQDIFLRLKYKTEKWWTTTDVHGFSSAAGVLDKKEFAATGEYKAMNSYLGTEIDLTLNYAINPTFVISGGYSQMFGTESMKALRGGQTDEISNWAYIMIGIKPNFLK